MYRSKQNNQNPTLAIYAVDMGTRNIVISKTELKHTSSVSLNDAAPYTVADMTDIRQIPNRMVLSVDNNSKIKREFCNGVSCIPRIPLRVSARDIYVNKKFNDLPTYISENMVLTHIKEIIRYRENLEKSNTIVDKNLILATNNIPLDMKSSYLDIHGARCIAAADFARYSDIEPGNPVESISANTIETKNLGSYTVTPINSDHALLFGYLERYIFHEKKPVPAHNVILINLGHERSVFTMYYVAMKDGSIFVTHQYTYVDTDISGKMFNREIHDLIQKKISQKYPNFSGFFYKRAFKDDLIDKVKHQLSTNDKIRTTVEIAEEDLVIEITREEVEQVIYKEMTEGRILSLHFENMVKLINTENVHIEVVGGSSRIPIYREQILKFKKTLSQSYNVTHKDQLQQVLSQDESVANGAATFGWLLKNPSIAKNINFTCQSGIVEVVSSFRGQEKRTTAFDGNEITFSLDQLTDTYINSCVKELHREAMFSRNVFSPRHIQVVRIPYSEKVSVVQTFQKCSSDSEIQFDILIDTNRYPNTVSHINILLVQNMAGLVDVVEVFTDDDNDIPYNLSYQAYNQHIDITTELKKFKEREEEFIRATDINKRRSEVINYVEGYYLDKDSVNKLICAIAKKNNIDGSFNIDTVPSTPLIAPLREVYEFYQFCRRYHEDPVTDQDEKYHDYITSVLTKDDTALSAIEKACYIIEKIKKQYLT